MTRVALAAAVAFLVAASGAGTVAQDKKDDKKTDTTPKVTKGFLPMNWGKIGLSDDQKIEVYTIQAKYGTEIEKLEAKIKELKSTRDKEMKGVLTAEQKKRLEEILLGKDK